MLNQKIFRHLTLRLGNPTIDLFASRLTKQISRYFSWKPDPYAKAVDAMQQEWPKAETPYAFPSFSLISRVLRRVIQDQISTLIIITPTWQTQPWYPQLLNLSKRNPILLPQDKNLLLDPMLNQHPLIKNRTLSLAAWTVSGKVWHCMEYNSCKPYCFIEKG